MKKLIIPIVILAFMVAACTERVDIELDDTYTRLVVEGNLTTDTTTHYIILSKTTSYYYNQQPPMVSNAVVTISDDAGNTIQLTESEPGYYSTEPDFYGVSGRTYKLRIFLEEEINGFKEYEAESTMPKIYPVDSIILRPQPDWGESGYIEVGCYYQDPPTKDFYMFDIYKNGEHLTDTISNRFVTDDLFYNGSYTNGIGVGWLDQGNKRETVETGDTIRFRAASINEEYANFVWTLQEEVNFSAPLFSGPPANVKSNINNGAVGFFATYAVAYSSTTANDALLKSFD
jgi:hypothetical protein